MSDAGDKLARTRLAIIEHVHRKEVRRHGATDETGFRHAMPDGSRDPAFEEAPPEGDGWMATASHHIQAWWRYHPAHMAVDLARPALASYARRKPVQYLGIAAGAGVLFLLLRPWKLISVTGVLVALLKSPQLAGVVMSALSHSQNPRDDEPVHR